MRYMILVLPKGYGQLPADAIPEVEALKKMQAFNKELLDAGVLLALDGLDSPAEGARVTCDTGKPVVTDGPFAEAKEVVGGYWLIDVKSREEAIGWAKRAPMSYNETLEVRKVHDYNDWPEATKKEIGDFLEVREKAEAKR